MMKKLLGFGCVLAMCSFSVYPANEPKKDDTTKLRLDCSSKQYTTHTPSPVILTIRNNSDKAIGFAIRMLASKNFVLKEPSKNDCEALFEKDYACNHAVLVVSESAHRQKNKSLVVDKAYNLAAKSQGLVCLVISDWNAFSELEIVELKGERTVIDKKTLDRKRISMVVPPHPPCPDSIKIVYKSKGDYEVDPYKGLIPESTCKPEFPPQGV